MEKTVRTFEEYLQEELIARGEVGGVPVTKDNCEDLFENYITSLDGEEWMGMAQEWMNKTLIEINKNK